MKDTTALVFRGGYQQFFVQNNLYYATASIPALWYSFDHDRRLVDLASTKKLHTHERITGELGVLFGFPVIPIGAYIYGRNRSNNPLINYAIEFTSTMYLTLLETNLLSHIKVHRRPDTSKLSKWETELRGDSSFPSGHVVPYAVLIFKTMQYYGPWTLIPTSALFYFASFQRIQQKKHYVSDVVGSFFLAAFASEGVRVAHHYDQNHSFYKWLFEHDVKVGLYRYDKALGPKVTMSF